MTKRYSNYDWILKGFDVLKRQGPSSLTIDTLCQTANKTRGSFYFHFESMDAYFEGLANNWLEEFTTPIIATTPTTHGRLDLLNLLAIRLDLELESGVRRLSEKQDIIRPIVHKADHLRIEWLAQLYAAAGTYSQDQAKDLAEIEYAAFVGFRLINPDLTASRSRELYDAFLSFTERNNHPR